MRWSELLALSPGCVRPGALRISWKLYELKGRFYRGRPKDGSIRVADTPPFLDVLLARLEPRRCRCRGMDPYCAGGEFTFLSPQGTHFRRSNYSVRVFRPAADGWYPGTKAKPASPVLVDLTAGFPGVPVPAWPAAESGKPFVPPTGRGHARLVQVDDGRGRCSACGRTQLLRLDGALIGHDGAGAGRCPGGGEPPAADIPLACWTPLMPGLTPHGLRHGHQPMMDNEDVHYVLQSDRMGHLVPGMRGTYSHPTPEMREGLQAALEKLWQESLTQRARLAAGSPVSVLNDLLTTPQ